MGTKAAAFAAKIKNLQESCIRIFNGSFPQPSPADISSTLKYFSQMLSSVLRKDVSSISYEVLCCPAKDATRIASFPNLDYRSLFNVLTQLLEILPQIQSQPSVIEMVGQNLLHTLSCLIPFLEHEHMDTLPFSIASSIAVLPSSLHKELLDMLCYNLLPFTVANCHQNNQQRKNSFINNTINVSVPSILMNVFSYTEKPAFNSKLLETFMQFKCDILKDIFCVIAYGTVKSKCTAVEMLFQYWPQLNPDAQDRKILTEKHVAWTPIPCQYENCSSTLSEAVKMSIDYSEAIGTNEKAPPLLICIDCADNLYKRKSRDTLIDILLPMEEISFNCENKSCKSPLSEKMAVSTCFSIECANYNCSKPVRYCKLCNEQKHGENSNHMVQTLMENIWEADAEMQIYFIEAIISLLEEAQPITDKSNNNSTNTNTVKDGFSVNQPEHAFGQSTAHPTCHIATDDSQEVIALEERHLLSRYGIWLITQLCSPSEDTDDEKLARLLAMLFQWFHYTACLPNDEGGSALEKLKGKCIHGWLMKVVKVKFHTFANCLLPYPDDCAKVSGHWDSWPSTTNQLKEGFNRLICLVPYDIITFEIWNYIMPHWMERFRHDVPEEELAELKILLSKILDADLSSLGFSVRKMYKFITMRFDNTTATEQKQALYWIQTLTLLEIPISLELLLEMFTSGINSLKREILSEKNLVEPDNNLEINNKNENQDDKLICFILMLDALIKQMDLHGIPEHKGLEKKDKNTEAIINLLVDILTAPWPGKHTCELKSCAFNFNEDLINTIKNNSSDDVECNQCSYCELCLVWFQFSLKIIDFFCPALEVPMTEKCYDLKTDTILHIDTFKLDSLSAMECDENEDTFFCIESDQNNKISSELCKKINENISQDEKKDYSDYENLNPSLKLLYLLLKKLKEDNNSDVVYHIIHIIKLLCLHAEILSKATKDDMTFLKYLQDNLLLDNFYILLRSECSQISELAVPLLLHCIILPHGKTKFWNLIRKDFNSVNWNVRFTAVERITTIAHFLDINLIKNAPSLQSSLANAFCYLVQCLDDIEAPVSQRTLLSLESIRINSLKLIMICLESQFDTVIFDRPVILQAIFQLYNHLCDRKFLTWDFFLNRFDALFLEAQVCLERANEINYTRDLKNSNVHSELYQKKIQRAQLALSNAKTIGSSNQSFTSKLSHKRPISNPLNINYKNIDQNDSVLKSIPKQASAPILRRKISKMASGSQNLPEKFQQHHFANSFCTTDNQFKQQMTNEEGHLIFVVHRILEKEEQDLDTMHTLVFLLMQFLSRPDQSQPQEEKCMGRNQQIVIKHLSILLGFSPTEKQFLISPNKLRKSPVFNAVLTSLPKVLDFNYKMGNLLVSTLIVPLLIYCPSPRKYIGDFLPHPFNVSSGVTSGRNNLNYMLTYSLYMLDSHARENWLMSVLILMYKYQYTSQPLHDQIQMLIQIVINTLESQFHLHCKPQLNLIGSSESPIHSRSRDLSNTSIDQMQNNDEKGNTLSHRSSDDSSSILGEDDENELEVIHESPKQNLNSITSSNKLSRLFGKDVDINIDKNSASKGTSSPVKHSRILSTIVKGSSENSIKHKESKEKNRNKKEFNEKKKCLPTSKMASEDEDIKKQAIENVLNTVGTIGNDNLFSKNMQTGKVQLERLLPIGLDSTLVKKEFYIPSTERLLPIGGNLGNLSSNVNENNVTINNEIESTFYANEERKIIDLPKSPLTTTTSLPLETSKINKDKTEDEDEMDINKSSDNIKNGKEKSMSEGKVDKVNNFDLTDIKKPFNSMTTTTTSVNTFGSSTTTNLSIEVNSILDDASKSNTKSGTEEDIKIQNLNKNNTRQYRQRKTRKSTLEASSSSGVAANVQKKNRKHDSQENKQSNESQSSEVLSNSKHHHKKSISSQMSSLSDDTIQVRCSNCDYVLEEFSEHELALCITILGTFVHREPAMSAHLLPHILGLVSKYIIRNAYSWQNEYNNHIHVPGNIRSVAKQLMRCTLYNLSSNGIFQQIFSSQFYDDEFFKAMTISLADFNELNIISPLTLLFQDFNERKHLPHNTETLHVLGNVATYLQCIPSEMLSHTGWNNFLPILEIFMRKLSFSLNVNRIYNLLPVLRIMLTTMKLTAINNTKSILDIYSKLLSQMIQQSQLQYEQILELCHICHKIFTKEREKYLLTKTVVFELVNCIKCKSVLPDENVMLLVQFLLQDGNGTLLPSLLIENLTSNCEIHISAFNTAAHYCCKQYDNELIEFVSDVHSLCRVKSSFLGTSVLKFNEETVGAQLKAGISQYLAIKLSRAYCKDHRVIKEYLPWLYSLPSVQNGAKEFLECVSHIRLLSWLLLGALQHSCFMQETSKFTLEQPIPLEANGHIAEHVQVILAGFGEQSNFSVVHMSSLFHAFILCQLWTMYCENICSQPNSSSEQYHQCILTLSDFWSKITPGILQLVCISKKLAEMVIKNFVNLMESLMECRSDIFTRLMPMWFQVLHSYRGQLSRQLNLKLEHCINWKPPIIVDIQESKKVLLKSLQNMQFKMANIEIQSSNATLHYPKEIKRV